MKIGWYETPSLVKSLSVAWASTVLSFRGDAFFGFNAFAAAKIRYAANQVPVFVGRHECILGLIQCLR